MRMYFFISALLFLTAACTPQREKEKVEAQTGERQQLYDEVMAVHDEVMPHMQDIRRYKSLARDKINTMAKEGITESEEINVLNNLTHRLDEADEAMMNWMRAFGKGYREMDDNAAIAYLKGQKEEVVQVKEKIQNTLQQAERQLK